MKTSIVYRRFCLKNMRERSRDLLEDEEEKCNFVMFIIFLAARDLE